ncbi:hypothetical protein F5Y08DRAFT_12661 [Xylaria arbuscula]|nr:hypothetical protein F5Y08DRAFT_12661 [Xylaria arbuscula]
MAVSMREQARQHFYEWVPQNVQQGIDGNDREMDYVSVARQNDYWTHDRIGDILGPYDKDVDIDKIQSRFIQVISILTYISDYVPRWPEYLLYFYRTNTDDDSLPLPNHETRPRRSPAPFARVHDGYHAWRYFSENQWKFLPLHFRPNNGIIERVHPPRILDPRHIIPVTIEDELYERPGGGARVVKVKPHEASGLEPENGSIVFKIYDQDRYSGEFRKERDIYTTIRNMRHKAMIDVFKYFLGYYGCYIQGNKCVLLIEYANQGSLLEFFRRNWHLPCTVEEAQDLWLRLGQLIKGLALLHEGGRHHSCLHQDIKPANIFVTGPDEALCFKFGDFGTSSVTRIAENGDAIGPDHGGDRIYSAPELCALDLDVAMAENITWGVDIWSFGCVLLDFGVWMVFHERGRLKFKKERIEETRSLGRMSLSNAGYAGAFHDGQKILSAVQNKIQEIQGLSNPVADLAANMMEFIQRELLLSDDAERLTAQQLRKRYEDTVYGIRSRSSSNVYRPESLVSQYSSTRSRTSIGKAHNSEVSSFEDNKSEEVRRHKVSPQPSVRLLKARNSDDNSYRQEPPPVATNSWSRSITSPHAHGGGPSSSASSSNLTVTLRTRQNTAIGPGSRVGTGERPKPSRDMKPEYTIGSILEWIPQRKARQAHVLEWLAQLRKRVRGRDQIFIFDNSESMAEHWPDVKRTGDALSYVVKDADPDGFDIHMTNDGEHIKRKDRKGLFDNYGYLDQHRPRPDLSYCPMEAVLSRVLEEAVDKALTPPSALDRLRSREIKGVSVYVLTNGVWESRRTHDAEVGEAAGVENAIRSAVKRLQEANKMRTFLTIQFISYGDDPEGRRRMIWLDDDIAHLTNGWDIVDTTHHTESAVKMIIGAIDGAEDGRKHPKATNKEPIGIPE